MSYKNKHTEGWYFYNQQLVNIHQSSHTEIPNLEQKITHGIIFARMYFKTSELCICGKEEYKGDVYYVQEILKNIYHPLKITVNLD